MKQSILVRTDGAELEQAEPELAGRATVWMMWQVQWIDFGAVMKIRHHPSALCFHAVPRQAAASHRR